MTRRSGRERREEDSPPDPARWLDRLDDWVEQRLPPPRGPLAELGVFLLRAVVGRGSWVAGAFLVAMSAPFFVFPYRQIETLTLAAFYRVTATATAEARVERTGVRLVPDPHEPGLRGEPYVVLAFEPEPGRTLRLRYLPHGGGLEPFHQVWLDAGLFQAPVEYATGWRLRWVDPASGQPAVEILTAAADREALALPAFWNGLPEIDNALAELDRPLDWLLAEWRRPVADDLTLPVRFRPGNPQRVFVGDSLSRLPPTLGSGWGDLFGALILALPFGLPFWWVGTRLLSRPLPRRWRPVMFWGPLALLPIWGTHYLEVVERLSPGASYNVLARKAVTTQVLPGAEPEGALVGSRQRLDLATSRFAPLLARVDLSRPARPLASADEVWRELVRRFTAATEKLPDAELEQVLVQESRGFEVHGRGAVAPVLIETARRTALDPERPEALRETARRLLVQVLVDDWPPCGAGFAAKRETVASLADFPHLEVVAAWRENDRAPCS